LVKLASVNLNRWLASLYLENWKK